jgi:hypothetical protein
MKKKLQIGHFLIGKSRGFIGQISCGKFNNCDFKNLYVKISVNFCNAVYRIMAVLKVETDIITSMVVIQLVMQVVTL